MKYLLLLVMVALSNITTAQLQKGKWLVGGSGSYSAAKSEGNKASSIEVSPAVGYFFFTKGVGGLRGNYGSDTYTYTGTSRYTNFSVSPFLRYYLLSSDQRVNLFGDVAYGFAWGKERHFANPRSHTFSFSTFSLMVGPAFFINEHIALELTLGYQHSTRGPIDTTFTKNLKVGVGFQIHL